MRKQVVNGPSFLWMTNFVAGLLFFLFSSGLFNFSFSLCWCLFLIVHSWPLFSLFFVYPLQMEWSKQMNVVKWNGINFSIEKNLAPTYMDAKCVAVCGHKLNNFCLNVWIFSKFSQLVNDKNRIVQWGDHPRGDHHHHGPDVAKAYFQGSYLLFVFLHYEVVRYHFRNLSTNPTTI